jgi:hypothetical protein
MKLYESLYIFLRYRNDISFLMEFMVDFGYREKKQNEWAFKEQAHYISLYNTIIMNVCSFLDEYNNHFSVRVESEFHDRIYQVKKIAKPAFKKLNEWKDIKDYRNHMIAHNFRIDGDKFSLNMLGQYNAPRTYRDLAVLRKHLNMVYTVIEAEFKSEMLHIPSFIDGFQVKEQKISYDTIESDLTNLVNEINQLCEANNKTYRLTSEYFMSL